MPRRLPVRPAKLIGNLFVLFVFFVIAFLYYTFVFLVWGPKCQEHFGAMLLLAFFHVFFLLLVWSLLQAMTTDPGQVPVFWGFHLGDAENKRRRYCLMCNVFKPERCHHCSACNRCVLNMDHHCPWINNCVGFWNRKYFMLLLVYVLITSYFFAIGTAYEFYQTVKWELDTYYFSRTAQQQKQLIRSSMIQLSFIVDILIAGLMTFFLKFHIYLMLNNKTTIENLEKKGQPYQSAFDVGRSNNFYSVFGTNPWLWAFPIVASSGKPLGDGIYWGNGKEDTQSSMKGNSPGKRSEFSPSQTGTHSIVGSHMKSTGSLAQSQKLHGSAPSYDKRFSNTYSQNVAAQNLNRQVFQNLDLNVYSQNQNNNLGKLPPHQYNQHQEILQSLTNYPQPNLYLNQQVPQQYQQHQQQNNQLQQKQLNNTDNRIIIHEQNQRDIMKSNLNFAIMQNHQKAQALSGNLYSNNNNNTYLKEKNSRQNTQAQYTTAYSSGQVQNQNQQLQFQRNSNTATGGGKGVLSGGGLNTAAPNKKVARRR